MILSKSTLNSLLVSPNYKVQHKKLPNVLHTNFRNTIIKKKIKNYKIESTFSKYRRRKKSKLKNAIFLKHKKIKCNNSPQILLLSPYHRRPAVQQINSALKLSFENYCFPPLAVLEM